MINNAKVLAEVLQTRGCDIVTGGTDTHLMLVDLRPKGLKGNKAEEALERAGITCNKKWHPIRYREAYDYIGHPFRNACGYKPRLWR